MTRRKIIYLCDNPTIQRVALISQSKKEKGGMVVLELKILNFKFIIRRNRKKYCF